MRRLVVFTVSLTAVLAFAVLTAYEFTQHGVTFEGIVSLLVLVFLAIALIGSLLEGWRR
jgi:hypothetical protein